jgi:hypothetical protein
MALCVCGHPEDDHDPAGACRVVGCPCEQFEPEIAGDEPIVS